MKHIKTREELIKEFIEFFKKHSHKHIPSSSLIPEHDPTVLFTTAGMHPLVPFLTGEKHPLGKNLVNVQKCIRTNDIDEVGDEVHHTFFEMLGNWSLGDYWKEKAISLSFQFLTQNLEIPKDKIRITCFKGDKDAEKDTESAEIWKSLGIKERDIEYKGKEDNWWGPAGTTGPCGPDTEIFVNNCEIWNDVFMQYEKTKSNTYIPLKQKNVDTGMGVERTLAILNNLNDNYKTSVFQPIIKEIESLSNKKYGKNNEDTRAMRIIADHIRAATFILGDERAIKPSNLGQGYVLRRLIRRAIRYGKLIGIKSSFTSKIAKIILPVYPDYQELHRNHKFIMQELDQEESRFNQTLEKGIKKFNEVATDKLITGKEAFLLFQSYGFPIEFTQELADEKNIKVDLEEYNQEFERHQDLSRTSSAGQFKSGLADNSEQTRKLHTATHLLNEVLRQILKKDIAQKGSNINPERLRFDFNFDRKLTPDEIKSIENKVNEIIKKGLEVKKEEMPLEQALKSGAHGEFGAKYPELVSVYTIIDKKDKRGFFSKEICTGPHVNNTKDIGHFKIKKEESVAAGIRRIKAVVE